MYIMYIHSFTRYAIRTNLTTFFHFISEIYFINSLNKIGFIFFLNLIFDIKLCLTKNKILNKIYFESDKNSENKFCINIWIL